MNNSSDNLKKRGGRGEDAAAGYLVSIGWRIVTRNYRCAAGEIDIVATDRDGVLCFVEVKARSGIAHGSGLGSITARKQQKLIAVANIYLGAVWAVENPLTEPNCRFDVIVVTLSDGSPSRLMLHRGAFTG